MAERLAEDGAWEGLVEFHRRLLDRAYASGLPDRKWKPFIRRILDIKHLHQSGRDVEAAAAIDALVRDPEVPEALLGVEVRAAAVEAQRRLGRGA